MKWFYDQLDLLYVNSEGYRAAWVDRGIAAEKIAILPRGLDTALFNPERREEEFGGSTECPRVRRCCFMWGVSPRRRIWMSLSRLGERISAEEGNAERRTPNVERRRFGRRGELCF
jgi:hypothetical protein